MNLYVRDEANASADLLRVRTRILRRLSQRAGVARMDSEAYDLAWSLLK